MTAPQTPQSVAPTVSSLPQFAIPGVILSYNGQTYRNEGVSADDPANWVQVVDTFDGWTEDERDAYWLVQGVDVSTEAIGKSAAANKGKADPAVIASEYARLKVIAASDPLVVAALAALQKALAPAPTPAPTPAPAVPAAAVQASVAPTAQESLPVSVEHPTLGTIAQVPAATVQEHLSLLAELRAEASSFDDHVGAGIHKVVAKIEQVWSKWRHL